MSRFLGSRHTLCLSPHPDDIEYSMSASIAQCRDTTFHIMNLTKGTEGDPSAGAVRLLEVQKFWVEASASNPLNIQLYNSDHALEIPSLITYIEQLGLGFDTIAFPPEADSHFEHRFTNQLAMALARHKPLTLVEYKTSSTLPHWVPNYHIPLSEELLKEKISSIRKSFFSQLDGDYFKPEVLKDFHTDFYLSKRGIRLAESFRIQVLHGLL